MLKLHEMTKGDGYYEVKVSMEEGQPPSFLLRAVKSGNRKFMPILREAITHQCRMIGSGLAEYREPKGAIKACICKLHAYLIGKGMELQENLDKMP